MSQRNILATLRSDTARDVQRYADHEVSLIVQPDMHMDGRVIDFAVTKTRDEGVSYAHITVRGLGGQRHSLMTGVALDTLAAAQVVVPLTQQDVADLLGAVALSLNDQPEKRDALLAKLRGMA
jgi:hypothetical protein